MTGKTEQRLWYYDDLANVYENAKKDSSGERLLIIIKWAKANGSLVDGEAQGKRAYPQFRLMGKYKYEIFSFWSPASNHTKPGKVHFFRTIKGFGGNVEYRRELVSKINSLLGYGYDLDNIDGSRSSQRALHELSEEEFKTFMNILDEYCYRKN
jgi:hypothetical protein